MSNTVQGLNLVRRRNSTASISSKSSRRSISSFLKLRPSENAPAADYVVVYQTADKKLILYSPDSLIKSNMEYHKVPVPGNELTVDLEAPVGPKDRKITMKIATVNLDKLGKDVRKNRKSGLLHHIYIIGRLPEVYGVLEDVPE